MVYERKERGLVYLADPLAGQAKLFADLSPGLVIKVNRKEYTLLPVVENLSREVAQLQSGLYIKVLEVLGLWVAPFARCYVED